jgi:acetyl-CoA carboxylase carboxyl transferase subunit alpha
VIDEVIPEPLGGAHRNPAQAAEHLDTCLRKHLGQLSGMSGDDLVAQRYRKFRALGVFTGQ